MAYLKLAFSCFVFIFSNNFILSRPYFFFALLELFNSKLFHLKPSTISKIISAFTFSDVMKLSDFTGSLILQAKTSLGLPGASGLIRLGD